MNRKAIALMSGGLDSTLAVRLMVDQGIEVIALNFKSPFCLCDGSKGDGCRTHAMAAAEQMDIEIRTLHKGLDYLDVIKTPKYGYGSAINPCVDCRIFTFKSAKKYMEGCGASFIVTGEVLGQRPMSQRRDPMFLIEKESGLEGLIVRPLSAKLLPPTRPEIEGIVDREKLLSIEGRSRKEQIRIAGEFEIEDYPCASGGCLLTDKNFGKRMKDAFNHKGDLGWSDVKLLTIGRHFRLNDTVKAVVGRNEEENRRIAVLGKKGLILTPNNFSGPTVYVEEEADGCLDADITELAAALIMAFSKRDEVTEAKVDYSSEETSGTIVAKNMLLREELDRMWLR